MTLQNFGIFVQDEGLISEISLFRSVSSKAGLPDVILTKADKKKMVSRVSQCDFDVAAVEPYVQDVCQTDFIHGQKCNYCVLISESPRNRV